MTTTFIESVRSTEAAHGQPAIEVRNLHIYYTAFRAVKNVNLSIERQKITALIGPSGCGKSTVLRSFNRMNDLIAGARIEGEVLFRGQNLYAPDVDAVEVRRRIGMVFRNPTPSPNRSMRTSRLGRRSTAGAAQRPRWTTWSSNR
jgi:phosphate transport system ATP-binding protein